MNYQSGVVARSGEVPVGTPRPLPARAVLRRRFFAGLFAVDLGAILLGFFAASLVYPPVAGEDHWLLIAAVLAPVYLVTALGAHAYRVAIVENWKHGVLLAARSFCVAAAIILFVAFYMKASSAFSRAIFGLGWTFSTVLLATGRAFFLRRTRDLLGGSPFRVVAISDGSPLPAAAAGATVVSADLVSPDERSPASYDRLARLLKDADRVVVACGHGRREAWTSLLKGVGIQSEVIAPELAAYSPLRLNHWGDMPTMVVADGPMSAVDAAMKRAFDLGVALTAIVFLAPLLLLIAAAVKLTSRGPALFVQTRIGYGNAMFRMYKFRSMRVDRSDHAGDTSARRDDDRVTPVGRLIRATSLDELPQIFNVLIGNMSIVGPRPHPLGCRAEEKLFWEIDERYWHRHAVKPGLTGLAQVRGFRGATMIERDLTDRLQADLEYLNGWSIWRDIAIVLMTFRVLMHRNAF